MVATLMPNFACQVLAMRSTDLKSDTPPWSKNTPTFFAIGADWDAIADPRFVDHHADIPVHLQHVDAKNILVDHRLGCPVAPVFAHLNSGLLPMKLLPMVPMMI